MTNELPKSSLLRINREFNQVYRAGRRLHGEGFSMIYIQNDQQYNRLGISIPRKVGNAVRRNRIKRIIRDVFRKNREQFPPHADIVIAVRPGFSMNTAKDFFINVTALQSIGNAHPGFGYASR